MDEKSVRIGQRVKVAQLEGEWIVLDRTPASKEWWIQNAETGAIGQAAPSYRMSLVRDDYRPNVDMVTTASGELVPVKYRAGRWCVVPAGNSRGWVIIEAEHGRTLTGRVLDASGGYRTKWLLADAKKAAQQLASLDLTVSEPPTTDELDAIREALAA